MTIPKRIPRKANFGGTIYKIKKLPASKMPPTEDEDTVHVGHCSTEDTEILILKTLSQEAQRNTYEHEAGHAAADASGARTIMAKYTDKSDELEEDLCRIWLPCYLSALRSKAT